VRQGPNYPAPNAYTGRHEAGGETEGEEADE
jgi:hypothetical protein